MASNHYSSSSSARKCLCSPTNHPGSFRCQFHRNAAVRRAPSKKASASQIEIHWERMSPAAKANSVKAFLLQIIKPSSHDLHRRRDFKPKPSRFFFLRHDSDALTVS